MNPTTSSPAVYLAASAAETPAPAEAALDFDSDTPLERPAQAQACSLEPGCEACQ